MKSVFAKITFIDENGHPVDPGFGGGRPAPGDPDYGIDTHPHPGHGLPHPPVRPGHDLPPWEHAGVWPPKPTDPAWGVDGDPTRPDRPDNSLPPFVPLGPGHPDNALPPVAGTKPPTNPPPGSIWPPLPGNPPPGKAALLVWLIGVGWRYLVVDIPQAPPPAQPKF